MRNAFVLGDILPGLEMPPDVWIGDVSRRQGEQADKEDRQERVSYGREASHEESIIAGDGRAR